MAKCSYFMKKQVKIMKYLKQNFAKTAEINEPATLIFCSSAIKFFRSI